MTPEAQRIAIAEACGWKTCKLRKNPLDGELNWWSGIHPTLNCVQSLLDYLNDLNAMHEAEKLFTYTSSENTLGQYVANLKDVVKRDAKIIGACSTYLVRATAAQRAEAFLRTLNLWKNKMNTEITKLLDAAGDSFATKYEKRLVAALRRALEALKQADGFRSRLCHTLSDEVIEPAWRDILWILKGEK